MQNMIEPLVNTVVLELREVSQSESWQIDNILKNFIDE